MQKSQNLIVVAGNPFSIHQKVLTSFSLIFTLLTIYKNQMRFLMSMYVKRLKPNEISYVNVRQKVGPSFIMGLCLERFYIIRNFSYQERCRFCLQHVIVEGSKVKFDVSVDDEKSINLEVLSI
ncbi:hypothetical protein S245_023521 [Arachis hypogaea]